MAFFFPCQIVFCSNCPSLLSKIDVPILALQLVDKSIGKFCGLLFADEVGASDTSPIITSDSKIATEQILMN